MSCSIIRALVVDDEPNLCALTKEFLEMQGDMRVDYCCSVREAREVLTRTRYEAIVSDYQMPGEDGIQFLKSLRAGGDRTPFILFTGKGREEVVIEALNHGADSYLQKVGQPVPLYAELGHRIKSLVRRYQAEEGLRESENRLLRAEEVAKIGHWQLDLNSGLISGSRGSMIVIGTLRESITFNEWRDAVLTEHRPRLDTALKELIEEGIPYDVELKVRRHNDGRIVDVHSLAEYDPQKRIVFGVLQDVSERKRAEESLRQNNEELFSVNTRLKTMQDALHQQLSVITQREDDLKKEIAFSESLMDSLPGIFYLYDARTLRLVRWNKNHEVISGYSPEEMAGKYILDWHRPENAEAVLAYIESSVTNGQGSIEFSMVMKDGHEVPFLLTVKRLQTKEGVYLMGVGIDISERKRAEEELRSSEARLDQLSRQNRTVTWETDRNGLYTYVCHASESIYGYRPEELVGKRHFYDLVPETERRKIKEAAFEIIQRREQITNLEVPIQVKDGHIIWVVTNGLPLLDASGELLGYQGNDTDITTRKRETMAVNNAMATMENSMDGVGIIDGFGRFVFLNDKYARIFGYDSPSDLIGKSWRILFDRDWVNDFDNERMPALFRNGQWRGMSIGHRRDGSCFSLELSLTRLREGDFICIAMDQSESDMGTKSLRQNIPLMETDGDEVLRSAGK